MTFTGSVVMKKQQKLEKHLENGQGRLAAPDQSGYIKTTATVTVGIHSVQNESELQRAEAQQ